MKRIIEIYQNNRDVVEYFITASINRPQLKKLDEYSAKIVYAVDKKYMSSTPYINSNSGS